MDIQAFLFDLNGVFYEDNKIINGANEIISLLRKNKIPYKFISNNSTLPRKFFVEKLIKIGLDIKENEVYTANYAGVLMLKKLKLKNCKLILNEIAKQDYKIFLRGEKKVDAIIIGDIGTKWDYNLMNELMDDIFNGAKIIALHKGKYYQSQGKLKIDCGAFVSGLEYVTSKKALVVGKPNKNFFELVTNDWDFSNICIVGDDHTNDIMGGLKMGFKTILVRTGKYRQELYRNSKFKADYCIESISNLKSIIHDLRF